MSDSQRDPESVLERTGTVEQSINALVQNAVKVELAKFDNVSKIQSAVRLEIDKLDIPAMIQKAITLELAKLKDPGTLHDEALRDNQETSASSSKSNLETTVDVDKTTVSRYEPEKQHSQQESSTVSSKQNSEKRVDADLLESTNSRDEPENHCLQVESQSAPLENDSKSVHHEDCSQQSDDIIVTQAIESQVASDVNDEDYVPSESSQNESQVSVMNEKKQSPQKEWKKACQSLWNKIWRNKDSKPFREKVDGIKYPDYFKEIAIPMDLTSIREDLEVGNYKNVNNFFKDMDLIFSNSRQFNTSKRSRIYKQTTRIRKIYESGKEAILSSRKSQTPKKGSPSKTSPLKNKAKRKIISSDEEEDDDNVSCAKRLKKSRIHKAGPSTIELDDTDSASDEDDRQSSHRASGRRTRSTTMEARKKNRRYKPQESSDSDDDENDEDDDDDDEESDSSSNSETSDDEETDTTSRASTAASNKSEVEPPPSITLTPSDELRGIRPGDSVPELVGRVLSAEDEPFDVPAKDRSESFDLYKFVLTNDDGMEIQCQAWRDMAGKICRQNLRKNRIVTLKNVEARPIYLRKYNKGNMDYVIEIKYFSEVNKEPKDVFVERTRNV